MPEGRRWGVGRRGGKEGGGGGGGGGGGRGGFIDKQRMNVGGGQRRFIQSGRDEEGER